MNEYPPSVKGEIELFFRAKNFKMILGKDHPIVHEAAMEWLAAAEFNKEMGLEEQSIDATALMMIKLTKEN
jgi:hypothetical protein